MSNPAHFRRALSALSCVVATAACAAQRQPDAVSAAPVVWLNPEGEAALVQLGALLVSDSAAFTSVWPGYRVAEEQIAVMQGDSLTLLINVPAPPAGARPMAAGAPPALREKGRLLRGTEGEVLDALAAIPGGMRRGIWQLPPDTTLAFALEHVLHEQFHKYSFTLLKDREATLRTATELCLPPALDTAALVAPEFAASVERERRLLSAALGVTADRDLRRAIREFLDHRYARTHRDPGLRLHEVRMERAEGSAEYVGIVGAARALGSERGVAAGLQAQLTLPLASLRALGPDRPARLLRTWLYATGAAQGVLLDRLRVVDWRPRLLAGESFDQILAREVGWNPPAPWPARPAPDCRPL